MPEIDHILSSSGSAQSGENVSSSQENVASSLSVHSVKNNDTKLLLETAESSKELAACHFLISAFKYVRTKNQGRVGSDDIWAIDAFLSDQGFPPPTKAMSNLSESTPSFAPGDSAAGNQSPDHGATSARNRGRFIALNITPIVLYPLPLKPLRCWLWGGARIIYSQHCLTKILKNLC